MLGARVFFGVAEARGVRAPRGVTCVGDSVCVSFGSHRFSQRTALTQDHAQRRDDPADARRVGRELAHDLVRVGGPRRCPIGARIRLRPGLGAGWVQNEEDQQEEREQNGHGGGAAGCPHGS